MDHPGQVFVFVHMSSSSLRKKNATSFGVDDSLQFELLKRYRRKNASMLVNFLCHLEHEVMLATPEGIDSSIVEPWHLCPKTLAPTAQSYPSCLCPNTTISHAERRLHDTLDTVPLCRSAHIQRNDSSSFENSAYCGDQHPDNAMLRDMEG